jgi:hypothetical protein
VLTSAHDGSCSTQKGSCTSQAGQADKVDGMAQLGAERGPPRQAGGERLGVQVAEAQSMAFMDDVLFSYYQAPMTQGITTH